MIEAFIRLIQENLKPGIQMAEVGVWQGETTVHYLPMIKAYGGQCYLVDWFCGNEGAFGIHEYNNENAPTVLEKLTANLRATHCEDVVTILNGKSVEMAANIPDNSLDICFLDADHRYESVKQDMRTYLPKVKVGGILCGHDAERTELANTFTPEELEKDYLKDKYCHPGVVQAVYDMFTRHGKTVKIWSDYGQFRIPVWSYIKTEADL